MTQLVWLNGRILPAEQAAVPVLDRGFLFGESVYETFRTYGRYPWLFLEHMERLEQSTRALEIPLPATAEELWQACLELAARIEGDAYQRIMVTGGPSDIVLDPNEPRRPNLLIFAKPFTPYPEIHYTEGARIVFTRTRRNPSLALNPRIKSCNLLNNIFAFREAVQEGAVEAVMLNTEGWVAEGASSNIFIIQRDGRLMTPHLDVGLLEGVTRRFVLWLARRYDLPCREEWLQPEDVLRAEECFLTSSLKGIMPVTRVNGHVIGDGRIGPMTRQLMEWYANEVEAYVQRVWEFGERPVSWL